MQVELGVLVANSWVNLEVTVVTIGRFVAVWADKLLHCIVSRKHLAMIPLLPLVTRC